MREKNEAIKVDSDKKRLVLVGVAKMLLECEMRHINSLSAERQSCVGTQ